MPQPKRASIKESVCHILFDEAPRKLVLSTIIIYVGMKVECHTSPFGISFTKIPFFFVRNVANLKQFKQKSIKYHIRAAVEKPLPYVSPTKNNKNTVLVNILHGKNCCISVI